ncbi:MAG: hypothetical protein U1D70_05315 [Methylobacter sp.]|nr:hypothetical protein [Methylobacter sp.]
MERCPSCMARLAGAVVCPRCQADLGSVSSSEHYAQHWLAHAVRFWFQREPALAMSALTKSMRLKRTASALTFSDFIIRRQVQAVLALLAQKQLGEARQLLALACELQPDNELLTQLQGFTDFLATAE